MKILIIDPQFFLRSGLIQLLTNYADHPAIYEANSFAVAADYLQHADDFNVIFMEMDLPDEEIRPALQAIKKYAPRAHLVAFTWSKPTAEIRQALSAGMRSYLPKDSSAENAKAAVRAILQGDRYLPEETHVSEPNAGQGGAENFLSPRQLEIMQLLAQGLSNKEIANILGITEGTIRVHLSAIFKAIKVSNRTEATLWYLLRQKKLVG
ncbi:DNA-binding response regulator [Idiomarina tyrosinivorans]|uniref:DNA-binding response regulator n=1 Tax=Idiomarina tyrosinivorans TaxID=1445662 RepID=A0A432ZSI1_9GAMM|nr:response regulator transcription factor [Idiomarina tyrosinivorans]RUO80874.1 DNA-binding response regulator [Idiomarina tyrosinivorans]